MSADDMDLRSFLSEVRGIRLQPGEVEFEIACSDGIRRFGTVTGLEFVNSTMVPALIIQGREK
jgi:hypothetical protein